MSCSKLKTKCSEKTPRCTGQNRVSILRPQEILFIREILDIELCGKREVTKLPAVRRQHIYTCVARNFEAIRRVPISSAYRVYTSTELESTQWFAAELIHPPETTPVEGHARQPVAFIAAVILGDFRVSIS